MSGTSFIRAVAAAFINSNAWRSLGFLNLYFAESLVYESPKRHGAEVGDKLMKTATVKPYNHVRVWEQLSRMFEGFDIFIFGVCHVVGNKNSGAVG